MQGQIVLVAIRGPGAIRADDGERYPFWPEDLIRLPLSEALGCRVEFDLEDLREKLSAVRIRRLET